MVLPVVLGLTSALLAANAPEPNPFDAARKRQADAMMRIYLGQPEPPRPAGKRDEGHASAAPLTVTELAGGEAQVTSGFGMRRSPFNRMTSAHHDGIDIAARRGAPVRSAADGVVVFAGWRGGYGQLVEVAHGDGVVTRYAHCAKLKVKKGQRVRRGQVVATVGSTGRATGPHLHFEIRAQGRPVNPRWALRTFAAFRVVEATPAATVEAEPPAPAFPPEFVRLQQAVEQVLLADGSR